ncbi:MAG TPA: TolC family protein, partial [Nitrospinaceae bacterium]|nr:TolC family protein [Nitrospinaceae bacterium]
SKLATTVEANVVQGNSTLTLPFPVKTIKQESKILPKIALVTNVTDELSLQSGDNNKIPGNSLALSLRDVVMRTLVSNLAIEVEGFNSKVKAENVIDGESKFDATFEINLSEEEEVRQQSNAFSSPVKSRNKSHNWDFSLTQKLVTGADYKLSFTNDRNRTNSVTAGLNPSYFTEMVFSLTQPLLKNFGIDLTKRNIYIANNEVNISDYVFEDKVIDIISDVENVYWDLVFSIEDLAVKKKSLERARNLERQVKAQVAVGTMAEIETLQAQSEVASRDESLLVAQDLIQDNEDILKNILNIDYGSEEGLKAIYPSDRPEMVADEINLYQAIKDTLLNRPDYLGKKKELENKNILVKFRENQLYPTVDLFGTMGLNGLSGDAITVNSGTFQGRSKYGGDYGTALSDSLTGKFYNWEVGLKLSYPLGNRSAKAQLSASRLEKAQLILSIKDLEKSIIVEVREAVRQLKTDLKRINATRIARKLAEEKLKAEEKKFEVGLSTSFSVLEFQEDLAEEQSNEIKALIDFKKSKIRLRQVMATTLKENDIKLKSKENT